MMHMVDRSAHGATDRCEHVEHTVHEEMFRRKLSLSLSF